MRSENLDWEGRAMLADRMNDVVRRQDCDHDECGALRKAGPVDSDIDKFDLSLFLFFLLSERGTSSFGKFRRRTWLTH